MSNPGCVPVTVQQTLEHLVPISPDLQNDSYDSWPRIKGTPRRYGGKFAMPRADRARFVTPPISPFDLFAITGHMLELSGAYHHVVPVDLPNLPNRVKRPKRLLRVTSSDIAECRKLADIWREELWETGKEPSNAYVQEVLTDEGGAKFQRLIGEFERVFSDRSARLLKIHEWWDELFGLFGRAPIYSQLRQYDEPPRWWSLALKLFIVADEASAGAGFTLQDLQTRPWFERERLYDVSMGIVGLLNKESKRDVDPIQAETPENEAQHSLKSEKRPVDEDLEIDSEYWLESLSEARCDVLCVLPKARTTPVGCTMRSLSHHLALLPPRGVARAQWVPYIVADEARTGPESEFNILLIPFPFTVTANDFRAKAQFGNQGRNWGLFEVEQNWLKGYHSRGRPERVVDGLAAFIEDLAGVAINQHYASRIDAIVFPELALNYTVFQGLQRELSRRLPQLELIITGLSDNGPSDSDTYRQGNFVGVSRCRRSPTSAFTTIREKHHRWCLDSPQIKAYGLGGVLNPELTWWEDIDLLSRRVDFTAFRKNSVLAAMICEDLARVDPCQEVIRSIGPNIVVALLMDAPQLPTRWPARYATVLAEDPGSSVLTLTSRGLMTHQHHELDGKHRSQDASDRVIALWRDNYHGYPIPLSCPSEAHGIWLKLWSAPVAASSLDGRENHSGVRWTYAQHHSLSTPRSDSVYEALLGQEDKNLRQKGHS